MVHGVAAKSRADVPEEERHGFLTERVREHVGAREAFGDALGLVHVIALRGGMGGRERSGRDTVRATSGRLGRRGDRGVDVRARGGGAHSTRLGADGEVLEGDALGGLNAAGLRATIGACALGVAVHDRVPFLARGRGRAEAKRAPSRERRRRRPSKRACGERGRRAGDEYRTGDVLGARERPTEYRRARRRATTAPHEGRAGMVWRMEALRASPVFEFSEPSPPRVKSSRRDALLGGSISRPSRRVRAHRS